MKNTAGCRKPQRVSELIGRLSPAQMIAVLAAPLLLIVLAVLYVIVVAAQGRPFLYVSERMRSPDESFRLYKIRTMRPAGPEEEQAVLCGLQARRVTPIGAVLRRTRLDELPQIINVLKGDIRFIGPRPPLRRYVEAYPDLYGRVLSDTPPGITGLATVTVHRREERLLSACRDSAEADRVYRERCIPVKARLDLIYRRNRGVWLDALILFRTVSRLVARAPKRPCPPDRLARPAGTAMSPSTPALAPRSPEAA